MLYVVLQVSLSVRLAVGMTAAQVAAGTDVTLARWLAEPETAQAVARMYAPDAVIRWLYTPQIWYDKVRCLQDYIFSACPLKKGILVTRHERPKTWRGGGGASLNTITKSDESYNLHLDAHGMHAFLLEVIQGARTPNKGVHFSTVQQQQVCVPAADCLKRSETRFCAQLLCTSCRSPSGVKTNSLESNRQLLVKHDTSLLPLCAVAVCCCRLGSRRPCLLVQLLALPWAAQQQCRLQLRWLLG
jgi:hypothetical protein